jgi:hypothetical protein
VVLVAGHAAQQQRGLGGAERERPQLLEDPGVRRQFVPVFQAHSSTRASPRRSPPTSATSACFADASLRWLIAPASLPGSGGDVPDGVRVGMGDVERFRDTVEMFRELDDRFGGGHARDALIQYLRSDAVRLLRGRYPESVGNALLSTVAEATLVAAWMTYDSTPASPQAQRYFIQALGLAQAGGDRLLGASILDAMSHQATYTGRFQEAANLAQAARTGAPRLATATLTAHYMQASRDPGRDGAVLRARLRRGCPPGVPHRAPELAEHVPPHAVDGLLAAYRKGNRPPSATVRQPHYGGQGRYRCRAGNPDNH